MKQIKTFFFFFLTRSLREPGGPCTKSMEVSKSRMERVKCTCTQKIFLICERDTIYKSIAPTFKEKVHQVMVNTS